MEKRKRKCTDSESIEAVTTADGHDQHPVDTYTEDVIERTESCSHSFDASLCLTQSNLDDLNKATNVACMAEEDLYAADGNISGNECLRPVLV